MAEPTQTIIATRGAQMFPTLSDAGSRAAAAVRHAAAAIAAGDALARSASPGTG